MDSSGASEISPSYDVLNYATLPNTPGSFMQGLLATFSVNFKDISHVFSLSPRDVHHLETHRGPFLTSLEESDSDSQPKSSAVLVFRFLDFLLSRNVPTNLLAQLFRAVQNELLQHEDIHGFVSHLPDSSAARKSAIRTYLRLLAAFPGLSVFPRSSLFSAAAEGAASVLMAFGGQGAMNPVCVDELSELYSIYQPLVESLINTVDPLLQKLSKHPDTNSFYLGREISLRAWLLDPNTRPEKGFIAGAAVSFPIIGIIDMIHYCIICKMLDKTPGELRQLLCGVTGHSQGIVVATAIARSDSWESFLLDASWAVELLFWLGYESHTAAPQSLVPLSAAQDSIEKGYGVPSHMLAVRGLGQAQLEKILAACNRHLPAGERLCIALINGPLSHVVAGAPLSLRGLTLRLDEIRAKDGQDQSRVPYSKRKPAIVCQFLPISAPFHSAHLKPAAERVKSRFSSDAPQHPQVTDLHVSTFHTAAGRDLRELDDETTNVAHIVIDAVTSELVDWPKALGIGIRQQPTHIVALGGGRFSDLVFQNVDGRGTRVIDGTGIDVSSSAVSGAKAELFAPDLASWQQTPRAWGDIFKPRLRQSASGNAILETRLNRVFNAPPIMTAGMTPTTVSWDFVSAVMMAGYHIELAGGGYRNPAEMTAAIEKLAANIPTGRGITCNLIYVSPAAMAWQIPLIRQLVQRGLPVEGVAIGAGVPSIDVAAEYIQTLGLRHISFKPGSVAAIREVIMIAKAHPTFPVILQWTGGRGGGHHSCEDFHEPLIETYSEIRRCPNLYLVLGSGFGNGASAYSYLTGEWSLKYGRPAMPCDGMLLGSRMMVAREAHTSPQAKALLLKAPGVDDAMWESSYNASDAAGGVLTVTSEMGQPIHKLATRGVRFWKEMDDTIFSLPRAERTAALQKRKAEIIRRLNADFAKPWFGQLSTGQVADLEDMTYAEVLYRLIQLMYVQHQERWIDPSYRKLVDIWAIRIFERLGSPSALAWNSSWLDMPRNAVSRVIEACPDAVEQTLHPEDVRLFINSCKERGRKPPNFIVALDDDFEVWFKKDSLWQSEDVDAVVDQDPERVCILQSPVSVRYATRDDQSAKEILDEIHHELVTLFQSSQKHSQRAENVPSYVLRAAPELQSNILTEETETYVVFRTMPDEALPEHHDWLEHLGQNTSTAIYAVLAEATVSQSRPYRCRPNPFRQIFAPRDGFSIHLYRDKNEARLVDDRNSSTLVSITASGSSLISIKLFHSKAVASGPAVLTLDWTYDEQTGRLIDSQTDRDQLIRSFYADLWLDHKHSAATDRLTDTFRGNGVVLTKHMHRMLHSVIAHAFADAPSLYHDGSLMPLEAAVIAAWEVLMRPLLVSDMEGDLLRLVHRSMHIAYAPGAAPLRVDDVVTAKSSVRSVTIEPSGKSVSVQAHLEREGRRVVTLTSEFFIKGEFSDYNTTFRHRDEPEMELKVDSSVDEAILRDRNWFVPAEPSKSLQGMTLRFQLTTLTTWKDQSIFASIKTRGIVKQVLPNGTVRQIGSVIMDALNSRGNPVMAFLQRRGKAINGRVPLAHPGWTGVSQRTITAPRKSSPLYATISGDYNPIHVSSVFAAVAGLPGPIIHGMYTAAVCRKVVEELAVSSDVARLRSFKADFVGMVQGGDRLTVDISHEAMQDGRMILEVVARQAETGEKVLQGEAEVEQPPTAYLFTGQGSQSKGMGMALYESSPVARALWDEMDKALMDQFGWSILNVVRNNPTDLTIHFRGPQGRKVLANYLAMKTEVQDADGSRRFVPVIPDLTPRSTSYTFSEPRGLLWATQFAQPAIVLLERATINHMQANGMIQEGAMFAGHSLGEYGALYSMAEFAEFKNMLSIGFYRGLMMQFAIPRDAKGQTGYAMAATNPGRVGKFFDNNALRAVVDQIAAESGELLEIVNLNIIDEQYVCAGHVRNLHCLTEILDILSAKQSASVPFLQEFLTATDKAITPMGREITDLVVRSRDLPLDHELRRGKATIPLAGIDVPFHSMRLRSGVDAFRRFLQGRVKVEDIRPENMVGKWVPNVMGRPFSLEREYIEAAAKLTSSPVLAKLSGQNS
ncbi:hypothetical protein DL771_006235 [Monosporascus sp. 5C6A]|nr:hypothetical protein DL771_006235 [Monosporascus sp. 5C6A]